MIRESEIRERLAALVGGDVSLDDFEDWFAVSSWNAHKDSSAEAIRLVGAIELRLGEHSNGHLPFADLRHELEALLLSDVVQRSGTVVVSIPVSFRLGGYTTTTQVASLTSRPRRLVVSIPDLA
jgi:hypothetical protein